MPKSRVSAVLLLVMGTLVVTLVAAPAAAEDPVGASKTPARFVGRLVDAGGAVPRATATRFMLHVDTYSDDAEVLQLAALLRDQGQGALVDALTDMKEKGWLKVGDNLGYQVSVIRSIPTADGGRLIRVITDRPIQFAEVMRGLRSRDYPFGIIELKLAADGTGEGVIIAAAQIGFTAEGRLGIESHGTQPFRILAVKPGKV